MSVPDSGARGTSATDLSAPRPIRPRGPARRISGFVAGLLALCAPTFAGASPAIAPATGDTPHTELPEAYVRLLEDDKVAAAIVWEGPDGSVDYRDWSRDDRDDLTRAVIALEKPEEPTSSPDEPGSILSPREAWATYLGHVAHALWLEAGRKVPWSLLSFTPDQLALLLDARELLDYLPEDGLYRFGPAGAAADRDAGWGHRFMVFRELLGPSQEETVWALGGWLRRRVTYPPEPPRHDRRGTELRSPASMLATVDGASPSVADCHELAGLMIALLRSVNIPAAARTTRLGVPGAEPSEHSRVDLPTLGRSVADASLLAMPLFRPSGNVIPTAALFPTLGWIAENISHPHQVDCRGEICNRPEDQALYNMARRAMDLAVSHLPDGLLIRRIDDPGPGSPAPAADALLSGRLAAWGGGEFAKPFFDGAERREIVRRIDEEIRRVGDGDWHLGADRVRRRWLAAQPSGPGSPDEPGPDRLRPALRDGRACAPGDPASPTDGESTTRPTTRSTPREETDRSQRTPPCGPDG
jgi:hypothetical protein